MKTNKLDIFIFSEVQLLLNIPLHNFVYEFQLGGFWCSLQKNWSHWRIWLCNHLHLMISCFNFICFSQRIWMKKGFQQMISVVKFPLDIGFIWWMAKFKRWKKINFFAWWFVIKKLVIGYYAWIPGQMECEAVRPKKKLETLWNMPKVDDVMKSNEFICKQIAFARKRSQIHAL